MKLSKILLGLGAIVLLGSACSSSDNGGNTPGPGPSDGTLVLSAVSNAIQADGTDACTFTVMMNGEDVTADADIFLYPSTPLTGNTFTTSEVGDYTFYASKGTTTSGNIDIKAVKEIPALPEDAQPSSYDFKRRILVVQHTGTGCGWCPFVIGALQDIAKTEYADKAVFVGAHSYNSDDPMYLLDAQYLAQAMALTGYPHVTYDLRKNVSSSAESSINVTATKIKTLIDNELEDNKVRAGLSATAKKVDDQIIVTVGVKLAEAGRYKVGAWLLEDGISATQSNYGAPTAGYDYNTHENVLRKSNLTSNNDVMGFYLGASSNNQHVANQTIKHVFTLPYKNDYDVSKLRVAVMFNATDVEGSAKFYTNNVISCPVGESVAFEYE